MRSGSLVHPHVEMRRAALWNVNGRFEGIVTNLMIAVVVVIVDTDCLLVTNDACVGTVARGSLTCEAL